MKKKLLILIIILSLFIIGIGIFLLLNPQDNPKTKKIKSSEKTILIDDESLKINICNDTESCKDEQTYSYTQLKSNTDSKELNKIIDKVNTTMKEKHNITLKSETATNKSCKKEVKEKYKYSKFSTIDYYLYENDKYITYAYRIYDIDLCNNTGKETTPKVYIYSKEKEKIITQEEFKKEINMTNKELKEIISKHIATLNTDNKMSYSYDYIYKNKKPDIKLFYNPEGKLTIYFYQSNDKSYQLFTVEE